MTEKNYNPEQKNAKAMKSQKNIPQEPLQTHKPKEEEKTEAKAEEGKKEQKPVQKKEKIEQIGNLKNKQVVLKKNEAVVNGTSVPISTLDSVYICNFIRRKTIDKAIADLEEVLTFKRAIPMKREIPHRKGKIMSGRYPLLAVKQFIKLLKNLQANATVNGLEGDLVIVEAIANMAYRPFGRFGRVRRKRTHIKIKVMEKKLAPKKKTK